MQAIIVYRIGNWLSGRSRILTLPVRVCYHVLNLLVKILWGINIESSAKIGPGLYIGHFGGINISGEATLGHSCNISQSVTIGVSGSGNKYGAPSIGDEVYIAPGARVFGKITVGNNVKIGANTVIHSDIPENAIVVLNPGFTVHSYKGNRRH